MYIIVYDFGTGNVKTCLFEIDSEINLICYSTKSYALYTTDGGGTEQDNEEWWSAICSTTHDLFSSSGIKPEQIEGLAFCSQMQSSIFVDKDGTVLRRPMVFLDHKGAKEFKECMGKGLIKVSGCNLFKTLHNLSVNRITSTSAKDTVWKYKWVEKNEPDVFAKAYKWLDAGDYLAARCTGRIVRTADSAFATYLYDTRKGKEGWNSGLVKMYGIDPKHLPDIIDCTDSVGRLTKKAAEDLGLPEGIQVFTGGDTTFTNIGAGCTRPGDTYIYVGTSGWTATTMDHQAVDINNMIAAIMTAKHGYYSYFAPLETGGKCFEWAIDHLALDELGLYSDQRKITDIENKNLNIYDYLSEEVSKVPAGANGVIFTPWLLGNRCPFEDSKAGGMFFNIRIDNDKRDMIRAVIEGICYHLRWLLECGDRKVKASDPVRFVGGGALSSATCQILADITGRKVETINDPQEVGAIGTALVTAAGIKGVDALELSDQLVKVAHTYVPDSENKDVYERNYKVFKKLYKSNAASFKALNS